MSESQARAPPAVARGLRGERDLRGSSVALSIALRSASSLVDRRGLIVTTEIGAIDDELRGRAA